MAEAREFSDASALDFDYEFDAPKFFDFTTLESPSQAQEAERWFLFANTDSPSPLIIKLNWRTNEVVYGESKTCKSGDVQHEDSCNNVNNTDVSMCSEGTPRSNGSQKSKLKPQLRPYWPKSPTLFKPTASHLAKLNQLGASSAKSNGRTQNAASPLNRPADSIAAKRQKLENGYLKKASQLRHQSHFAHKSSRKAISNNSGSTHSKPRATVPKGPNLKTNNRARRFRSVRATCQGDTKISKHSTFRALPLNRKIFEGPLLAQPKKSTAYLPEFQEFHFKTAERAMHNSSENDGLHIKRSPLSPKSPKSHNSSGGLVYRFKSQPANRKALKLSGDKKCAHNPPTELFSKMSLTSDNSESQMQSLTPMELKENLPYTLPPPENESPSNSPNVKHSQSGEAKAITDFRNHHIFTRSFKIY